MLNDLGGFCRRGTNDFVAVVGFLAVVVVVAYKWEKLGDEIPRTTFWSTACAFLSLLNPYWCFVAYNSSTIVTLTLNVIDYKLFMKLEYPLPLSHLEIMHGST